MAETVTGKSWEDLEVLRAVALPHLIVSTELERIRGEETEVVREDLVLVGVAASAGRVRGKARVVDDLAGASDLARGEILVTARTDGWSSGLTVAVAPKDRKVSYPVQRYGECVRPNLPLVAPVHDEGFHFPRRCG